VSDASVSFGRLAYRSLPLTPVLALLGIAEWFVPLTSPNAAGHALYMVVFVNFPFLIALAGMAAFTIYLARRHEQQRRELSPPVAWLQYVLLATLVLGGIPVLAFNANPDATMLIANLLHPLFGALAVGAVVTQSVLLLSRQSQARPAD
jgi:hypothetical protein